MRTAPATAAAPFHSCWPRMPHVAGAGDAACEWERQPPGNDATAETGSGSRAGSFNLQWQSGRTIVSPAISSSNAHHTHTHTWTHGQQQHPKDYVLLLQLQVRQLTKACGALEANDDCSI